jgi:hypothetical protein
MQSGGYLAVFGSFSGPRDPAGTASSVLMHLHGNCHAKEKTLFSLKIMGLAAQPPRKCEHVYTNSDPDVAL